jgi:predicted Fe-S protein YdhL (DUF1289 family)
MNPDTGWCDGCWRTLDEIATWSSKDDREKQSVWVLIGQRQRRGAEPSVQSLPRP